MNGQPSINSTDTLKKVRHDLGGVLGNFAALERFLFSGAAEPSRVNRQATYQGLIQRFEECMSRLAALESASGTKADARNDARNEVASWK